jgi:hypothetical protein
MRSVFFYVSLMAPILLFGQTYELAGHIQGLDADTLMILKVKGEYEFDYIQVADGKFHYQDSISEPFFVQLMIIDRETHEASEKLAEFLVEEGRIVIEADTSLYDSVRVIGSRSDSILKQYFSEDEKWVSDWQTLKLTYDEAVSTGDTLLKKELATQLNGITFDRRIPLLKRYVRGNRENIVGALLPNFCTLSQVLKPEDYEEIYDCLSKPIQETAYGQSIKSRTQ